MPVATDGTKHASFSRAKHHDERNPDKPKAVEKSDKPKPIEKAKGEGTDSEKSEQMVDSIVAEHGPAHEIHYTHDKASGKHHVKSKHGDANVEHDSEHDSEVDAADHMHKAMGNPGDETSEDQMGEMAGETMPAMEEDSRIPGLLR